MQLLNNIKIFYQRYIAKEVCNMKHYQIIHNGLIYCVDVYASSKKDAINKYRNQWNLVGKHINLQIWEV